MKTLFKSMFVVMALGLLWGCGSGEGTSSTTSADAPIKADSAGRTPSTGEGAQQEAPKTD